MDDAVKCKEKRKRDRYGSNFRAEARKTSATLRVRWCDAAFPPHEGALL
jgi:hypothetical protein